MLIKFQSNFEKFRKKEIWIRWTIFWGFFDKFYVLENMEEIFRKFSKLISQLNGPVEKGVYAA